MDEREKGKDESSKRGGEEGAYHLCPMCSKQKGEEDDDEEDVSS